MATYFFDINDFSFDATTKKYKIVFTGSRLQKIRHVVFENMYYVNSTCTSHVVLVHSNLCKILTKHKFFKGSHHSTKLDCLFSLKETHSKNRYELKHKKVFDLDRSIHGFELWFTNIDLELISDVSSAEPVNNGEVSRDDILNEFSTDLIGYLDFHPSRTLDAQFQECDTVGDDIVYLHSLQNTELVLSVQYGTSMKLANFNDTGVMKGVTSDPSSQWQSVFDNLLAVYNTTYIPGEDCVVSICFKLTGNTFVQLVEHTMFKIFYSGGLKYKDSQGQDQVVNNISLIPLQAYYLTCERKPATDEFEWTVVKLSDNSVQTATTSRGADHTTLQTSLRFGRSNTSFTQVMSYFFMYNNPTAARKTMLLDYITNLYGSNVESSDPPITHSEQLFFELTTIA